MFSFLKKNKQEDIGIYAICDSELVEVSEVADSTFASKMMGESIAFSLSGSQAIIHSPMNGKLSVVFLTGHAMGIVSNQGIELLIHIGIDTVKANGEGFTLLKKQGDTVKAGDPLVSVDAEKLAKDYDLTTMLIITNDNGHKLEFISPQTVQLGQSILKEQDHE